MRKAVGIAAGVVVAVLVAWAVLHVVITPVNPAQTAPTGHYSFSCPACHLVLETAPLVD